jgi:hypothetical protein
MIRSFLWAGLLLLALAVAPPAAMAAEKLSTPLPVPTLQADAYRTLPPQEQTRIETRAVYERAAVTTIAAGAGIAAAVVTGGGLATFLVVGGAIGIIYFASGN